ncbi:MAG: phosphohydrolase [Thermoplasmata archaeon]|nr:MAG: phosphohydrolase [Thermoplasmata archaeon]HDJ26704.1 HD domain-containing protein [Aciduliprofundum sp.]
MEELLGEVLRRSGEAGVHGLEHALRVMKWALFLGKNVGADLEVLSVAALLHDIVRDGEDHALRSAEEARRILLAHGYDEEFADRVYLAIRDHSYSSGRVPETLEGKVLSDADKLDALGFVGIARVFQYSGSHGRTIVESLEHIREKLLTLPQEMYLETSKVLAEWLVGRVEEFLDGITKELQILDSF